MRAKELPMRWRWIMAEEIFDFRFWIFDWGEAVGSGSVLKRET
jgi:hypothetical protein